MSDVGLEKALGKHLQEVRQAAGLTQQQLCQKANLSYSTLAKIERGAIKAPSIFTIQNIADVLGVSLDELIGRAAITKNPLVETKTSKSGIKFAYFDINGCLVRFFHQAFNNLAKETDVPPDVIENTFWHYNDAVCKGEITLDAFNKALAKGMGVKSVDWQAHYFEAIEPIKEMQELVEWAAEHYKVGLISNIMPGAIDHMLKNGIIPDVPYTAVVDSSEVNAIKPEKKIYEIAEGLAGVKPSEILLVDDSRTNVMAAEKMDWHVLWFDDFRVDESVKRVKSALEF
jgi:FMN phosphatase YigB (HAD superfamily)/DNA-binding XRE family transcriptional regulator